MTLQRASMLVLLERKSIETNKHRREPRRLNTRKPIRSFQVVCFQLTSDLDLCLKANAIMWITKQMRKIRSPVWPVILATIAKTIWDSSLKEKICCWTVLFPMSLLFAIIFWWINGNQVKINITASSTAHRVSQTCREFHHMNIYKRIRIKKNEYHVPNYYG